MRRQHELRDAPVQVVSVGAARTADHEAGLDHAEVDVRMRRDLRQMRDAQNLMFMANISKLFPDDKRFELTDVAGTFRFTKETP